MLTGASQKAPLHSRAVVNLKHIRLAKHFLDASHKPKDHWYKVKIGTLPIILVASHAAELERGFADRGTGPLVRLLHKLTGATIIYTCGSPPCDPNREKNNAFQQTLSELIDKINPKLVIDCHQAHPCRPFDVDFGTQNGRTCPTFTLRKLTNSLQREGLSNFSQDYFPAKKRFTITQLCFEKKVCALQLEINSNWLTLDCDDMYTQRFAQLTQGLAEFLSHGT
ncbi:MAG: hypothetical protein KDK50_03975 [Chlamydiia bacterium]|nr:hypothetical protein [Chlamydiia bacterium]